MKKIYLKIRAYASFRKRLLSDLNNEVQKLFQDLNLEKINLRIHTRGHILAEIEGEDEEFAANFLSTKYGQALSFDSITIDGIYQGQLIDVGKVGYGLYVNIGILFPSPIDVLIPLYRIRDQTHLWNYSIRKISKSLVFVENLPIEITIIDFNKPQKTIEGALSNNFLARLNSWMNDDHERLLVFGANLEMIESSLKRSGHQTDIHRIEQLGYYEHVLVCKRSTRASGILAAIGPLLRGIPIHLFIPREVREIYNDAT